MRVAIYVRVSTEEQKKHGLSVDAQIQALRDYVDTNGHTLVDQYNDAGISASKSYKKRPELLRMLKDCRDNKIDLVIFTKLDRFFRSVPDYYACIEQMGGVPWRAIWEDYETETSAGRFKVNIMLSIAQAESDRTGERIKSVNEYKRASGQYVGGKAPTGYAICKGDLIKDTELEDTVQKVFDFYANSYSTVDTVRYAHSLGLNIARETFTRMLKNPTYCGDANGYKCEPYITVEQYEKNKASVEGRRQRGTATNMVYLFSGLIYCAECGRRMGGSSRRFVTGGKEVRYRFHRCLGFRNHLCDNNRTVTEMLVEKYLIEHLDEELGRYNIEATMSSSYEDNLKAISRLEAKLSRIGDRYEDGDISRDEYKAKRSSILLQIDELKKASAISAPKKLPSDWKSIYNELDATHKRAFWNDTLSKIVVHHDKELIVDIYF